MTDLWPTLHKSYGPNKDTIEFTSTTTHTCELCQNDSAIEATASEVICTRCGTILDIPLEWAAEYRWFSADSGGSDPSRCGFPINPLLPESSLGTVILNQRSTPMMRKIKRYHMWNLMPYRERTLWTVFEGLQVRAVNAGISTAVLEEAKELYAQLTASSICRGVSQRDAMLAACLWEALKRHDAPRMPKDIAEIFQLENRCVTKGIKQFQHILSVRAIDQKTDTYASMTSSQTPHDANTSGNEKEKSKGNEETQDAIASRAQQRKILCQSRVTKTTTYKDFVRPFLTNLSIPRSIATSFETMVHQICERIEELNIVPENTPPSLTAAVIAFCAAEKGVTLDHAEIARVCGISNVTIQKCLKRMIPWRKQLVQ